MKMATRKTNTEIVTEFMDFCPTGAMGQMFVIDALRKLSDKIIAEEQEVLEQMANGFVDGASWVATAKALKAHLDDAYKSNDNPAPAYDADDMLHN
jgi:hypothetical protein